jgi:hypothetical protein
MLMRCFLLQMNVMMEWLPLLSDARNPRSIRLRQDFVVTNPAADCETTTQDPTSDMLPLFHSSVADLSRGWLFSRALYPLYSTYVSKPYISLFFIDIQTILKVFAHDTFRELNARDVVSYGVNWLEPIGADRDDLCGPSNDRDLPSG